MPRVRPWTRDAPGPPAGSSGLSAEQAAELLTEHGPNVVPRTRRRTALGLIGDQVRDPMILLLLGGFAVVAAVGDLSDAAIIVAVICRKILIGVVQEVRSANALDALESMAAPEATVRGLLDTTAVSAAGVALLALLAAVPAIVVAVWSRGGPGADGSRVPTTRAIGPVDPFDSRTTMEEERGGRHAGEHRRDRRGRRR